MVGLPSIENREKILRTLLSKDKNEGLDFTELATMTEGYSGSDLKVSLLVSCMKLNHISFEFDKCFIYRTCV